MAITIITQNTLVLLKMVVIILPKYSTAAQVPKKIIFLASLLDLKKERRVENFRAASQQM
jgi:hypothetical protein